MRRGASISGVAAIEGLPDRDVPAKLAEVRLRASTQSKEPGAPFSVPSKIGPDGNFRIAGLRPGRGRFWLSGYPYLLPKGFLLMRVERNGVEQPGNGFDIAAGEQVSAVRVVIAYGNGVIRGQLKFVGETLPPDSTFGVQLNRVGTDSGRVDWWVEVDDRNRFLFEGIPPGDYELIVTDEAAARGSQSSRRSEVKRRVTVSNDAETEVTIIMEPGAKDN